MHFFITLTVLLMFYLCFDTDCPLKIESKLNDPLLILCTSGTTGVSKGAVYTNQSILAFCLGTAGIPRNEKPAMLLLRCTHVLGCKKPFIAFS